MKKIFLILLTVSSLFSSSIFTLENANNFKLYFSNQTDFLTTEQINDIKTTTKDKLKSAGIELNKVDPSTFMIQIESIEIGESKAVVVTIALGEEVLTNRKNNIETFAWTYYKTDFIETEQPFADIIESINYLLDGFIEGYLEDMESSLSSIDMLSLAKN